MKTGKLEKGKDFSGTRWEWYQIALSTYSSCESMGRWIVKYWAKQKYSTSLCHPISVSLLTAVQMVKWLVHSWAFENQIKEDKWCCIRWCDSAAHWKGRQKGTNNQRGNACSLQLSGFCFTLGVALHLVCFVYCFLKYIYLLIISRSELIQNLGFSVLLSLLKLYAGWKKRKKENEKWGIVAIPSGFIEIF